MERGAQRRSVAIIWNTRMREERAKAHPPLSAGCMEASFTRCYSAHAKGGGQLLHRQAEHKSVARSRDKDQLTR